MVHATQPIQPSAAEVFKEIYQYQFRICMQCRNTYLTARMCMGCDRRRPVWGESTDEEEEEGGSGEMWLSACECWPCRGWMCCVWWRWWWWWWCEEEVCPLCSSGVDSVCWPLQVEYRLSSEEFISFTRASKSTSSSGGDRQRARHHLLNLERKWLWKMQKSPKWRVQDMFLQSRTETFKTAEGEVSKKQVWSRKCFTLAGKKPKL